MSMLLLDPLPVHGATERDGERVITTVRNYTALYKSGVKAAVEQLIENLPLDHRAYSVIAALESFMKHIEGTSRDLEGAIENAVERET